MSEPLSGAAEGARPVSPVRAIRAAFVTLTRLPVGGFPYSPAEWREAPGYFPLVGGAIGTALGVLCFALSPLGETAAAALTVGCSLLLTGAFHEDGLADTADALGGASDRERAFAILKDSRIGSFGAAALCLSIVIRVALIARLGGHAIWALPLAGCVARVGPIWLLAGLPYVSPQATARYQHVASAGNQQAWIATGCGLLFCVLALLGGGVSVGRLLLLGLAIAAATRSAGWYFQLRLGGVTGDLLGAAEQLAEVVALSVLAWGA
jgi:adenosylcobinamide-GDP ribazoletransferase